MSKLNGRLTGHTCVLALAASLGAQSAAAQSVSYSSGTYVQDFDALPLTGSTNAWSNGSTLNGWYSGFGPSAVNATRDASTTAVSNLVAATGSGSAGGLYSYGSTNATDRALGSQASGTWEGFIALVIRNDSGTALTGFALSYDGEQWRNAANVAHSLVFDFAVFGSLPGFSDLDAANTSAYTPEPLLNFTSPLVSTGSVGAVNGNAAANRTAGIAASPTVTVPDGAFLVLRWWDNNDSGNDHGLGIDNLSFTATSVPTPGASALLVMGALAVARRRRG